MPVWEYINPMAFVWYLCKKSKHFRYVMLASAGKVMEIHRAARVDKKEDANFELVDKVVKCPACFIEGEERKANRFARDMQHFCALERVPRRMFFN